MSNYSCAYSTGASYFLTLVAYRRQNILYEDALRPALRSAISRTCTERPFVIDAWLLLPDHLHCIWTLPPGDADFSTRWNMIKRRVSLACSESHRRTEMLTASKSRHRGSTIWQRRYWEHQIRD